MTYTLGGWRRRTGGTSMAAAPQQLDRCRCRHAEKRRSAMQRQAFALLLSAVCAVIVTTGSAQAASTTVPVMTANAAGSDNTVVGTLNVHWRRRATCSATLTAEGLRGSLHRGRTASGGGIEWRWVAGASAPGGQWTAAVRCSQGNSHAGASARFLVPRSTPRGRVHQLIRPGS